MHPVSSRRPKSLVFFNSTSSQKIPATDDFRFFHNCQVCDKLLKYSKSQFQLILLAGKYLNQFLKRLFQYFVQLGLYEHGCIQWYLIPIVTSQITKTGTFNQKKGSWGVGLYMYQWSQTLTYIFLWLNNNFQQN